MSGLDAALALLRARRSVRRYRSDPVPAALLDELLAAAVWAPSASNRQNWEFVVVTAAATKQLMAEAVRTRWQELTADAAADGALAELRRYAEHFAWFAAAPAVIAVACRRPELFLQELLGEDAVAVAGQRTAAAMAAQNLMLAATAAGLGSCCLTGPLAAAAALRPLLGLHERQELVCLITVGYPAEELTPPARKAPASYRRYLC